MKIGVGIGLSYPKYAAFVNRGGANFSFSPVPCGLLEL